MVARSVARGVARSVGRGVAAADSGAAAAFSPSSLSPLQWALDGGNAYESSTLDSYQVLRSLESYGTYRKPRSGRCGLFDGTDDVATLGARLTSGTVTALTLCGWMKTTDANGTVFEEWNSGGNLTFSLYVYQGKLYFSTTATGSIPTSDAYYDSTINDGTWKHFAVTYSAGTVAIYIKGVSVTVTGSAAASLFNSTSTFRFGGQQANGYLAASLRDMRVYSTAKSAAEIAAIYNQASTPTTIDSTGLLGAWWLNEEAGTTAYDWSGNGKHLTLTNITTSTFHAADTGVTYNPANFLGFTLSGSTVIPRNEANTSLDASGGALGNTGPCPHPALIETPCITTDGAGTVYLDCPHLTGSETVVSSKGTATVTVATGKLTFNASKTVAEIVLSDGTHYVCCEGAGTDGTNRTVYDVSSGANHATITNGTVATIWAARLAGTAQDWFVLHGGRVDANNVAIPGRASGSLAADGNAKNRTAGKHGNPYSRFSPNPWAAPEMRAIGATTSTLYAPAAAQQSVSPADTKFRRTAADGDDRFFSVASALTGTDKTNAEAYVA